MTFLGLNNKSKKVRSVEIKCKYCKKIYKHRSGLSRHQKKCKSNPDYIVENMVTEGNSYHFEGNNFGSSEIFESSNLKEKVKVLELEKKILEKDLECAKTIDKMKDQFIETLKTNATTNNNYKDCAINNTQNININLFLNKDCKNAMNLEDFVDNIKVQLEDILYQSEAGAVDGLTNIIAKQLQNMPVTSRPIHCTDEKRLQFYVKEEDEWNKKKADDEVLNIREQIKNKSILAMEEWENANEGYTQNPKLQDEYSKIMGGILEGYDNEKNMGKQIKKLRKNLAKHVSIKDAIKEHVKKEQEEEEEDEIDFFGVKEAD